MSEPSRVWIVFVLDPSAENIKEVCGVFLDVEHASRKLSEWAEDAIRYDPLIVYTLESHKVRKK